MPAEFEAQRAQITEVLRKLSGKLEIKNADERNQIRTRRAVLNSPEFKALWDRIKHQTTYRVEFDNEKLIQSSVDALHDAPPIAKSRLQWRKADLSIGKGSIDAKEKAGADLVTKRRATSNCRICSPICKIEPAHPQNHHAHPH